ncbi:MAG: putative signal transducing protein [Ignavibacteriaceae bacterium]
MPVCPNCSYEYIEGVKICPDCGINLIDEKSFVKPEEWTEQNWEVVFTSDLEYEAEMMKDNLEGAGIHSEILSQADRSFPAPGDLSVVKLFVPKKDVQAALNFIEQFKNRPDDQDQEQ